MFYHILRGCPKAEMPRTTGTFTCRYKYDKYNQCHTYWDSLPYKSVWRRLRNDFYSLKYNDATSYLQWCRLPG